MLSSTALERAWKSFFSGSWTFEDVYPEVVGEARVGREEGVDLYLCARWRVFLPSGLIQVKSSPAEALNFLEEGRLRGTIIPVVIGPPPLDATPEEVLRRLALDYCWHPRWKAAGEHATLLANIIGELTAAPEGALLRRHKPAWAAQLE